MVHRPRLEQATRGAPPGRAARRRRGRAPPRRRRRAPSSAARSASPVPRGSSWSAVSAHRGDGLADRLGRGRVDDQRARARGRDRRIEHVVDHRPAAERVEHLGRGRLHARAEAGREDDRDRAAHGRAGTGGFTGPGRRDGSRPGDRMGCGAGAREGVGVRHLRRRGFCGVVGGGVNRRPAGVAGARAGDRLDLHEAALGQRGDRHGRTGRRRIRHVPAVHAVDDPEVAHVGEEDRRLHDVGHGQPGGGQDGGQVVHRSLRLGRHALDEDPGGGIEAELAAAEDEAVDGDGLAVRADGGRRAGRRDGIAGHGSLRVSMVPAEDPGRRDERSAGGPGPMQLAGADRGTDPVRALGRLGA